MSTNLMEAANQWATRPADERFWGLHDLHENLSYERENSREREYSVLGLKADMIDDDLVLTSNRGHAAHLTNWSFGQLCRYTGAPPSYLQNLPPDLAATCINYGLALRDGSDKANLLLMKRADDSVALRSMTTDHYSRLWNEHIITSLKPSLDRGWMVPPARPSGIDDPRARRATVADIVPGQDNFGLSVKAGDMIAPAGVYKSDRDMFVFLVNPNRIIDDGQKGLMRGVFIWNSEVGAGAFKVQTFYLENVCGNHIVWGASNISKLKIVHKGNALNDFAYKTARQLSQFADMDTVAEKNMIASARSHVLGKNKKEVCENVSNMKSLMLSKGDVEETYDWAEQWEHTAGSPPTTAWGFVHGMTRYSQHHKYADARSKMDVAAGKILQLAAPASGKMLALPAPGK